MQIQASEVADVLRAALRGEIAVRLIGDEPWGETGFGNFEFAFGEWRITFFNDAMELDYVDSAIAPDGRTVEYSEWFTAIDGGADPIDLLSAGDANRLADILESIRPR